MFISSSSIETVQVQGFLAYSCAKCELNGALTLTAYVTPSFVKSLSEWSQPFIGLWMNPEFLASSTDPIEIPLVVLCWWWRTGRGDSSVLEFITGGSEKAESGRFLRGVDKGVWVFVFSQVGDANRFFNAFKVEGGRGGGEGGQDKAPGLNETEDRGEFWAELHRISRASDSDGFLRTSSVFLWLWMWSWISVSDALILESEDDTGGTLAGIICRKRISCSLEFKVLRTRRWGWHSMKSARVSERSCLFWKSVRMLKLWGTRRFEFLSRDLDLSLSGRWKWVSSSKPCSKAPQSIFLWVLGWDFEEVTELRLFCFQGREIEAWSPIWTLLSRVSSK